MRKTKWLMGSLLSLVLVVALEVPAFAKEPETRTIEDSTFPTRFIGYSTSSGYNTILRGKDDKSYHYIMNTSGFNLWVISKAGRDKSNQTIGGHAIVPNGEWFIANLIKERGYSTCYLNITTATSGTSGYLSGKWSPDSVGNYPVVN